METSSSGSSKGRVGLIVGGGVAAVLGILLVVALLATMFTGLPWAKVGPGEVSVIRNGGVAANQIRAVLEPAGSYKFVGWFHTGHKYPASQRFYTITSNSKGGDRPGVDVEAVPTKDGVQVGLEATIYFTLNTDPKILADFDTKYGNRTFRTFDNNQKYAWDGPDGWSAFLDQIVRPVLSNNFREQIGNFQCYELVSSCALVQNNGSLNASAPVSVAGKNNVNISKVQEAVRQGLIQDINTTLGGPFLQGFQVNLVKVTLPSNVQDAVNRAQAAFAQVTEAQARVQSAKADAQANVERQRGYVLCPACSAIDQLKAIPPTITTFAPGAGFAITK